MFNRSALRTTWFPFAGAIIALVVLNFGLYTRLASQPARELFTFPYQENFATMTTSPYEAFGGDWAIRDEALVQLSTSGYDLATFIPLNIEPEQAYRFSTNMRFLGGTMGGGLMFNAQQLTSRQKSHMARFNVDGGKLWLIYGYFGDDSNFIGQGSAPLEIAPEDPNSHRITVQVDAQKYAVIVDDVVLATDIPLQYPGGAVGFISATSQVSFDDISVGPAIDIVSSVVTPLTSSEIAIQPTAAPALSESTLLMDTFDRAPGVDDNLWRPISGSWTFENGELIQSQADGFDLSTVYQEFVSQPFNLSVGFQHRQAAGGGLLFNLPTSDSKAGGHMVRYFEDGTVMAWGYFDNDGVFNGQGSAAVNPPQQDLHTLNVKVAARTYDIVLDGVVLASGVPIVNPVASGYIGLTASQSVVAFNDVSVTTTGIQTSTDMTTANIDTAAATGSWKIDAGVITQSSTDLTDYVAGIGLAGEHFTLSVKMALPAESPDVGAGVIFHMDGRDDRRLGHMVRLGSGGKELFWGHYDEGGTFVGEGGVPLTLSDAPAHTMMIVVRKGSFDILIDGTAVVENIPIERSKGWIGLVSFSGPLTFSEVNLQLSE